MLIVYERVREKVPGKSKELPLTPSNTRQQEINRSTLVFVRNTMTSKSEVNTPTAEINIGTQLNEMRLYGESTGSIK